MGKNRYTEYLAAVRDGAEKCARLEFLQPDGSVGFRVDGDHRNRRSGCFLQSGWLSCNRKNGMRRYATVTLGNPDGEFSYAVNHLWYGTLWGTLEGDYSIGAGTNVFTAMESLLRLDRYDYSSGGSNPVDGVKPVFSTYWNGRTQTLTDGRTVPLTSTPYSLLTEGGKTLADILLSLAGMLAADIGYNRMGRLCVEPGSETGQEESRPVLWEFCQEAPELFGLQETGHHRFRYGDGGVSEGRFSDNLEAGLRKNFTGYPLRQGSRVRYLSGSVSGYLGRVVCSGGTVIYSDGVEDVEELSELGTGNRVLFLRDPKGRFLRIGISGAVNFSVNHRAKERPQTVPLNWVEVGDAARAMVVAEGDTVLPADGIVFTGVRVDTETGCLMWERFDGYEGSGLEVRDGSLLQVVGSGYRAAEMEVLERELVAEV